MKKEAAFNENCKKIMKMQAIRVVFWCSCYLLIAVIYAAATTNPTTNGYPTTQAGYDNAKSVVAPTAIFVGPDVSTAAQHDVDINDRLSVEEQIQSNEAAASDALTIAEENVEKKSGNIDSSKNLLKIQENSIIGAVRTAKQEGEEKTLTLNQQAQLDVSVKDEEVHSNLKTPNIMPVENVKEPDVTEKTGKKDYVAENYQETINKNAENPTLHDEINTSLPDITIMPKVTITDLPLEILESTRGSIDSGLLFEHEPSQEQKKNQTFDSLENSNESINKDEQIIKIDDSGGGADKWLPNEKHIPQLNTTTIDSNTSNAISEETTAQKKINTTSSVNLTTEEIPIPVFSEWAQKQMEAAEKEEALQQEVVNNSSQKRNQTNGNGKILTSLKIRSKNYASPDCGAKIITSNADATNTGAVLSSSKDEYMLSPCGTRIWFVVELCEAIQARRIDLANFELFSSSPKNFSVAVSNRFPTRDWSNVGRFIAEDKRTVQSFDLHPQLFGKFVRVDIHSHYSKEHFCPVSLFRVFGTSEFEAFETENEIEELDDLDEELEQASVKIPEQNLFKSASDAVMSIVKKAAEVLVKPVSNENQTHNLLTAKMHCQAPVLEQFSCADCDQQLKERINGVLSVELKLLNSLLAVPSIKYDLFHTSICHKFGISFNNAVSARRQNYYMSLLSNEYVGALCQLLASRAIKLGTTTEMPNTASEEAVEEEEDETELPLNLTLGKKAVGKEFEIVRNKDTLTQNTRQETTAKTQTTKDIEENTVSTTTESIQEVELSTLMAGSGEVATEELEEQIQAPPIVTKITSEEVKQNADNANRQTDTVAPDINIYNLPASVEESFAGPVSLNAYTESTSIEEETTRITPTTLAGEQSGNTLKSEEDNGSWDAIDNLLTTTSTITADSMPPLQKVASSPQSESVFIRLSNRIKALERNMSLSGQYLEELSRRYKKQVEELQQALTQQTKMVRQLEEQTNQHNNMELLNEKRNNQLKLELNELSKQFHACLVVMICAAFFIILLIISGLLLFRSLRRKTEELLAQQKDSANVSPRNNNNKKKLNRRKSFEDVSQHQQTHSKSNEQATRRPSEEAMLIIKDCSGASDSEAGAEEINKDEKQPRRRKMSVFYGSNNNLPTTNASHKNNKKANNQRRKGEKLSLPARLQPWQRLEQTEVNDLFTKTKAEDSVSKSLRERKKSPQQLNLTAPANLEHTIATNYNDDLILEDDDMNFIPTADLAYNEFMPEGPSGYLLEKTSTDTSRVDDLVDKKKTHNMKKTRRLSSPNFFKSPFSKSVKLKANGSNNKSAKNTPHESTSWEWYRLKKSEAQQQAHKFLQGKHSTAGSLDSSSLSEINFPTSSTQNSFRILEEAIISSGEAFSAGNNNINNKSTKVNGSLGSGSSCNSNGSASSSSTASSATKKKSRSFNRILRKVF